MATAPAGPLERKVSAARKKSIAGAVGNILEPKHPSPCRVVTDGSAQQRAQHAGNDKHRRNDGDVCWILGRRDHEWRHDSDKGVYPRAANALDGAKDDSTSVSRCIRGALCGIGLNHTVEAWCLLHRTQSKIR